MNKTDLKEISKLLDDKLAPISSKLDEHGKMLSEHGKMLKSLKKDQDTMLRMLDKEQMNQRKRLNRIEDHLGFNTKN